MRTKYNVSRSISRFVTYRLVAFAVVIMTAIASVLGPVSVARANPISNFFGAVPTYATGMDVYLSWAQTTSLFEKINSPIAIADLNRMADPNIYFIETGYISDRLPFGFDPNRYPYMSQQDGPEGTYKDYVDKSVTLTDGPYQFKVLKVGYRAYVAQFCPGSPPACYQLGPTLYSTSHDSYKYAVTGYESAMSAPFTRSLIYTHAKFQINYGSWFSFCPYGFPSFGSGSAYAIILACTNDGMGGSNYQIVPASTVFMMSARRS